MTILSSRKATAIANQRLLEPFSALQKQRLNWKPELPEVLQSICNKCEETQSDSNKDLKEIEQLFPKTANKKFLHLTKCDQTDNKGTINVAVLLSGGQAPGGHNVICGLFDYLKRLNKHNKLYGFRNGPIGLINGNYFELTKQYVDNFRNLGGFHMIGSGRDKIESEEQKRKSLEVCQKLNLEGLLIIGGDDSNTNAALLSEYFAQNDCKTSVVGAPKTIDGDLKNEHIEVSFGFDTAVKTYCSSIGSLCNHARTLDNAYHFVRLMGRSASNIALECAMQTKPNLCFIGEEVKEHKRSVMSLAEEIADLIVSRSKNNLNHGVILIPEGLIEFIPEMSVLISEINNLLAKTGAEFSIDQLSKESQNVFKSIPTDISKELLAERDSHGNVQVSRIPTEKLLILMTEKLLQQRNATIPTTFYSHFYGYEGRCAIPSIFDATYCYALGHTAGALVSNKKSGYLAVVRNLYKDVKEWVPAGCPLTRMMNIEIRKGHNVPVIKKFLVDLNGPQFKAFAACRDKWKQQDYYASPYPIQFSGDLANACTYLVNPNNINLCEDNCSHQTASGGCCDHRCSKSTKEILMVPSYRDSNPVEMKADDCSVNYKTAYPCLFATNKHKLYSFKDCHKSGSQKSDIGKVAILVLKKATPGVAQFISQFYTNNDSFTCSEYMIFRKLQSLVDNTPEYLKDIKCVKECTTGGLPYLPGEDECVTKYLDSASLAKMINAVETNKLSGLIIVGGVEASMVFAKLSEECERANSCCSVILVPADTTNELASPHISTCIGADTAVRVYSELIGNLEIDATSAKKYWYFLRIGGGNCSLNALECAYSTHPNLYTLCKGSFDGELTLARMISTITDCVLKRGVLGLNYGVYIFSEHIVFEEPSIRVLLEELVTVSKTVDNEYFKTHIIDGTMPELSFFANKVLSSFPIFFRESLYKATHTGCVDVSQISLEDLLAHLVSQAVLKKAKAGVKFSPLSYYLKYQACCARPSTFDRALASCSASFSKTLIHNKMNGYIVSWKNLSDTISGWVPCAVPTYLITGIINSRSKPIPLNLPPYPTAKFVSNVMKQISTSWSHVDAYQNPGSIQMVNDPIQHISPILEYCSLRQNFARSDLIGNIDQLKTMLDDNEHVEKIEFMSCLITTCLNN